MSVNRFEYYEDDNEEFTKLEDAAEVSLSTKLERRRKIEDLFEEKRLREELGELEGLF